ncbi:DUF3108 domain-containing protein [Desulfococcaceae bacterium HSG9]|nr:DUF3108 domain-containing protein [Desulfococcaceae bacterium HSG9]
MRSKNKYLLYSVILLFIFIGGEAVEADNGKLPFSVGEKLHFELKWSFIPIGQAVLEVMSPKIIDGVPAYHFSLTAQTNAFADTFYKVRDKVDGYTDKAMTHSLLYKKQQHEGSTHRDVVVNFDWKKSQVRYITAKEKKTVSVLAGAFDPLSAFYYARLFDPAKHKLIERPITDGKKCVVGRVTVVKREKIKVGKKVYDTYLIMPELKHVGGVFKKSKNAKIKLWITADTRRLLVKIKSKVVVGSFVGELVSAGQQQ